ncbi:retinaldehyde-binding protein 1 isoform X4 [Drosophila navojoa]|uniref:retinaldehyde-binding protein 1 isoform X4 n=1 Tax=Drosophila navojoa TaxID=7232 RepID=UPI0011BE9CD4|nr:retinaldehyde-binding protein 1 isoform X4 [Drosophila navojoa]XP_030239207.1 retinaldehyde-binding protein 1 isoform X4 [Drosophila navojoa]
MGKAECISYDDNHVPYIDLGSARIRMEKEQAPDWALQKAQDELRELPGIKEQAIKELRELIQNEKHLTLPLDDEYMMMFLRPCHYYPESALKRLKNFYNMKSKYGIACENIVPSKLKNVFESEILNLLPNRDQHGRRILVLEAGSKKVEAIEGAACGSVSRHTAHRAGLHGGAIFTNLWCRCHN